jgi:hypothetical protein
VKILQQMFFSKQEVMALLLGLGSVLFLVAAFLPVSRVFAEPSPESKIEIIQSMRQMWTLGQLLFGLGALIVAASFSMLTYQMKNVPGSQWAMLAVILLIVGAIFWCWHLAERMTNPHIFAFNRHTPYLFVAYSIFTQLGLILIGTFFLRAGIFHWVALMFIISSSIFFLLMVIFKDLPPFAYYLITLIAAFRIYFNGIQIE